MMTTSEIRSHFPALKRVEAGRPAAYSDGPGGTQVPIQVADAMHLAPHSLIDFRDLGADFLACSP